MIETLLFYAFAALSVGFALAVVFSRNPVHAACFLVVSFFGIAGVFVLLHAYLVAAIQVLVYAGAVMVLFLFVIMLINLKEEETVRPSPFHPAVPLAVAVLILLGRAALQLSPDALGAGEGPALEVLPEGTVRAVSMILLRDMAIPIEITSVLLLAAIVGALALSRRSRPS